MCFVSAALAFAIAPAASETPLAGKDGLIEGSFLLLVLVVLTWVAPLTIHRICYIHSTRKRSFSGILVSILLMRSLFRDYVASVRPRGEPFRSRSMVLCLAGHHPVLSISGNARRQGHENNLCAPVPALSRSHPSVAVWLLNCGLLNK
jgi:hypothetical protein